jgi:antitoxin CptB
MKRQDIGSRIEDRETPSPERGEGFNPASSILNPAALQRIRWRCRRGLLELDIIFGRFVDAHYAQLTEAERQTFEVFLDMPDNPLWDLVSGRTDAESAAQAALLEKIKSV